MAGARGKMASARGKMAGAWHKMAGARGKMAGAWHKMAGAWGKKGLRCQIGPIFGSLGFHGVWSDS